MPTQPTTELQATSQELHQSAPAGNSGADSTTQTDTISALNSKDVVPTGSNRLPICEAKLQTRALASELEKMLAEEALQLSVGSSISPIQTVASAADTEWSFRMQTTSSGQVFVGDTGSQVAFTSASSVGEEIKHEHATAILLDRPSSGTLSNTESVPGVVSKDVPVREEVLFDLRDTEITEPSTSANEPKETFLPLHSLAKISDDEAEAVEILLGLSIAEKTLPTSPPNERDEEPSPLTPAIEVSPSSAPQNSTSPASSHSLPKSRAKPGLKAGGGNKGGIVPSLDAVWRVGTMAAKTNKKHLLKWLELTGRDLSLPQYRGSAEQLYKEVHAHMVEDYEKRKAEEKVKAIGKSARTEALQVSMKTELLLNKGGRSGEKRKRVGDEDEGVGGDVESPSKKRKVTGSQSAASNVSETSGGINNNADTERIITTLCQNLKQPTPTAIRT
ncbi:hypothetical protein K458DRAFT_401516 [Lentithecium fluviatile CBS 122367]|uniref:Uncharacterized protein n=1 Tax=Lentithecium fluviatile CBS 122367 TaxID=1168545 RepID=A0A6G1JD82_9PLEO|nr:hypothetical protein K458DRAFT_401516 [Lentithecium fluviatile CBS 122367]